MFLGLRRAARVGRGILVFGVLATMAAMTFASPAMAGGSFVIGDGNAAVGTSVTFWGAQWWSANSLSGGLAPASFKGFADTPSAPPACGETWSSRPGNSSEPPPGPLPGSIDVIVSSQITQSGPAITGATKEVVVVKTEPGYAPNPGHAGVGTVVEKLCSEGTLPN